MKIIIDEIEYNLVLTHIADGKVIASVIASEQDKDLSCACFLGEFKSPTFHCNNCNAVITELTPALLSTLLPKEVKGEFFFDEEGDEQNEYNERGYYEYLPVTIIE